MSAPAIERDLTVPELANEWDCSEDTIRRYIGLGELRAEKVAGKWLIAREDIDAYRKRQQNVARRQRRPILGGAA